jgi:hypothetical protein
MASADPADLRLIFMGGTSACTVLESDNAAAALAPPPPPEPVKTVEWCPTLWLKLPKLPELSKAEPNGSDR